ncbi:MAG: nucleotidyltransferase family protein [Propylenella sp.]
MRAGEGGADEGPGASQLLRLAAALRAPLGLPDVAFDVGHIDPPLVRFAARRHRVECLLHWWLESPASDRVTLEAAALLRARRERNAMRVHALDMALEDVRGACGGAVSSLVTFKGPSLARQLYGDPLLSRSNDLDVLVEPRELTVATKRLFAAGFTLQNRTRTAALSPAERIYHRLGKEMVFVRPLSALPVELHQRRLMVDRLPPFALAPAADASIPNPALDAAYAAYLLAHGAQTHWHRLKWLADLTQVWRHLDEAAYRALIRHCERAGIALAARASLLLAEDVFPRSVPGVLLEWAANAKSRQRVADVAAGFLNVLSRETVGPQAFWRSYRDNPYDSVGPRFETLARVTALSVFRRIQRVL